MLTEAPGLQYYGFSDHNVDLRTSAAACPFRDQVVDPKFMFDEVREAFGAYITAPSAVPPKPANFRAMEYNYMKHMASCTLRHSSEMRSMYNALARTMTAWTTSSAFPTSLTGASGFVAYGRGVHTVCFFINDTCSQEGEALGYSGHGGTTPLTDFLVEWLQRSVAPVDVIIDVNTNDAQLISTFPGAVDAFRTCLLPSEAPGTGLECLFESAHFYDRVKRWPVSGAIKLDDDIESCSAVWMTRSCREKFLEAANGAEPIPPKGWRQSFVDQLKREWTARIMSIIMTPRDDLNLTMFTDPRDAPVVQKRLREARNAWQKMYAGRAYVDQAHDIWVFLKDRWVTGMTTYFFNFMQACAPRLSAGFSSAVERARFLTTSPAVTRWTTVLGLQFLSLLTDICTTGNLLGNGSTDRFEYGPSTPQLSIFCADGRTVQVYEKVLQTAAYEKVAEFVKTSEADCVIPTAALRPVLIRTGDGFVLDEGEGPAAQNFGTFVQKQVQLEQELAAPGGIDTSASVRSSEQQPATPEAKCSIQ